MQNFGTLAVLFLVERYGTQKEREEKYRKAEYKAAHIWHSRHAFPILVTLNVHMANCSDQG